MTQPITEDDFRALHAQHLRDEASHIERQTSALESIRGMLTFLVVLVVLGLVCGLIALVGAFV